MEQLNMEHNDTLFEEILNNLKSVDGFVEEFFSFLSRRTDFFLECPPEGGPYGFPKGAAEKIVLSKFHKWQSLRSSVNPSETSMTFMKPSSVDENTVRTTLKNETKTEKNTAGSKPESSSVTQEKSGTISRPRIDSADVYNGRETDKYSWSQTIGDIDIKVPVGTHIKKGKDLKVTICNDLIRVDVISSGETLVDGKLTFPISKEDSYWNLHPGESVSFWLQKVNERWWTALFQGEEPIDISQIEAVRPMEDLGEEEQMKIQELMWDQDRKMRGLPTTKEMNMMSTIKQAWDKDGSPFKGQPFDPSLVKME